MTVAFIVSATGGKVTEPIVIWKSKIPRCFRYLEDKSRPANLHYFRNEKSWMNTDIMVKILSMLDAKMKSQNQNVILFLDNAPCHLPDLKGKFSNIMCTSCQRIQLRVFNLLMLELFKTLK